MPKPTLARSPLLPILTALSSGMLVVGCGSNDAGGPSGGTPEGGSTADGPAPTDVRLEERSATGDDARTPDGASVEAATASDAARASDGGAVADARGPDASSTATTCAKTSSSVVNTSSGDHYAYKNFGNYTVTFDDWGPDPGTLTQWINSPSCWSASTTTSKDLSSPSSYPATMRGWTTDATILQALSTSGYPSAPDWTTKSGMGILVSELTKVHVKWAMSVPTKPNVGDDVSRWDALIDIYFHTKAQGAPNPPSSAWLPQIDLQIMQMLMDSPLSGQPADKSGYFAYVMATNNPWIKTFGGVTYVGIIDQSDFNQPGGHTITMMPTPTMYTDPTTTGLLWGPTSVVHDVGGIIAWLSESNPTDDSKNPIKTSKGTTVTSPIIDPSLYLSAINAGFEIDFGSSPDNNEWTTTDFWVAMQDEPDGT